MPAGTPCLKMQTFGEAGSNKLTVGSSLCCAVLVHNRNTLFQIKRNFKSCKSIKLLKLFTSFLSSSLVNNQSNYCNSFLLRTRLSFTSACWERFCRFNRYANASLRTFHLEKIADTNALFLIQQSLLTQNTHHYSCGVQYRLTL